MNAAGLAVRTGEACYEAVSRKNLGENAPEHHCTAPDSEQGYRFSKAMMNPGFIGIDDNPKCLYYQWAFPILRSKGGGLAVH